jgi:small GTP-binding protein
MNKDILSPRICHRINIIGDFKSGKTTIFNNCECKTEYVPTISPNITSKNFEHNLNLYRFLITDTPGHCSFDNMNEFYYNNYDCLIIVIDLTNERSLENLPYRINRLKEVNENYNNNEKTIFIIGNSKGKSMISEKTVEQFAERYHFFYYKYHLGDVNIFPHIFTTIIINKKFGKPKFRKNCIENVLSCLHK